MKDPGLLRELELTGAIFDFFGFSLSIDSNCQGEVALCAISTDINNEGEIPEPATLGLFGIGLLALGFMSRRRKRLVA